MPQEATFAFFNAVNFTELSHFKGGSVSNLCVVVSKDSNILIRCSSVIPYLIIESELNLQKKRVYAIYKYISYLIFMCPRGELLVSGCVSYLIFMYIYFPDDPQHP